MVKTLKKVRKQARKPKSASPVVEEDSNSHIVLDIWRTEQVHKEVKDTVATMEPLVLEQTPSESIRKVSSPLTTSMPFSDSF